MIVKNEFIHANYSCDFRNFGQKKKDIFIFKILRFGLSKKKEMIGVWFMFNCLTGKYFS